MHTHTHFHHHVSYARPTGEDCDEKEVSDFLEEVLRMRGFHHRHVLSMLGLVLRDHRPYAVLPYMENGDLRTFLKDTDRVR